MVVALVEVGCLEVRVVEARVVAMVVATAEARLEAAMEALEGVGMAAVALVATLAVVPTADLERV